MTITISTIIKPSNHSTTSSQNPECVTTNNLQKNTDKTINTTTLSHQTHKLNNYFHIQSLTPLWNLQILYGALSYRISCKIQQTILVFSKQFCNRGCDKYGTVITWRHVLKNCRQFTKQMATRQRLVAAINDCF